MSKLILTIFISLTLLSCTKQGNDALPPDTFVQVRITPDLSMAACGGGGRGYLHFKTDGTSLYQSDSLPVRPGSITLPAIALIRFHPVYTHCYLADSLIVVDEIKF